MARHDCRSIGWAASQAIQIEFSIQFFIMLLTPRRLACMQALSVRATGETCNRFASPYNPPMSLNSELSGLFSHMADIMDIKGENTFKVLAFRKVGRILKEMTLDTPRCVE